MKNAKDQDCVVCAETLRAPRFPETQITETCTHAPNTCLGCIQQHIETQLETRMWDRLSCPECPAPLMYANVERYASQGTFQRYDLLAMRHGICSDPDFRWCTAPECSFGQVHLDAAESSLMICNSCRSLSCFTHQIPWHEGMTCFEFDNLTAEQCTSEGSHPNESLGLLSSLAEIFGRNSEVSVGTVKRRETAQEKKDRRMAMRLFQEEKRAERKRLQAMERENRRRIKAEEAEQHEEARRVREVQEKRERQEHELQLQKEERQRQLRGARVRQQQEESASTSLLQKNTKACPGNCGWRIEKKSGCDHMTCCESQALCARYSIADFEVRRLSLSPSVLLALSSILGDHSTTRQYRS